MGRRKILNLIQDERNIFVISVKVVKHEKKQKINKYFKTKFNNSSSVGLGFSQLVSVSNRSELILYGGQINEVIIDGIWKFFVASKRWMKIGTMVFPRAAHTVIPVRGITCP